MADYKPTASEIKVLREKTLAGFQDCQKALAEANGDMNGAEDIIRKKGLMVAAKKAHREASDGLVSAKIAEDHKSGAMIAVNCETDFVAKTEVFQALAKTLADHALAKAPVGITPGAELNDQEIYPKGGGTVKQAVDAVIGQIGENMCFDKAVRFKIDEPGIVHSYIHPPGKIGVLVELGVDAAADIKKAEELAHEIALQIAFADPAYTCPEEVPTEVLERERKIAMEKAADQGKPEHMLEKIAEGMVKKYYAEECLLLQPYAKDQKITVQEFMSKAGVPGATIRRYARFSLKG
jgi:elongation factor Ts